MALSWLALGAAIAAAFFLIIVALQIVTWMLMPEPVTLKGKHVVVVGGSSGIGLAICQLAAAERANVTIIARNKARLDEARAQVTRYELHGPSESQKVTAISADVADLAAATKAVDSAVLAAGPIDVLVLSQGLSRPGTFEDTSVASMREVCALNASLPSAPICSLFAAKQTRFLLQRRELPQQGAASKCRRLPGGEFRISHTPHMSHSAAAQVMDTNVWGCVNIIKAALPSMKAGPGGNPRRIALISSQAGQVGVYGYAHYSASKFALRGLAECLHQELLPHNIRVSVVYPPDTDTPMLAEENLTKPEVTKLISQSSTLVSASSVARSALAGIKAGQFSISSNFDGFMLGLVTSGMSPEPSLVMALLQICVMGLTRIVALATVASWESIVLKWHRSDARSTTAARKRA
eukprot:jgi/Mesen1/948/ME000118S00124